MVALLIHRNYLSKLFKGSSSKLVLSRGVKCHALSIILTLHSEAVVTLSRKRFLSVFRKLWSFGVVKIRPTC